MEIKNTLAKLSDEELLRRMRGLLQDSRRVEAELIAHIGEVDHRRLYAREAATSMHVYCTEVLRLSDAEAYLRITVARASRKHPMLLKMLAEGQLHLSGVERLAPHLTADNREELLKRAAHRSRREIEELVAGLRPHPDVPSVIRRLPTRSMRQLRPDGVHPGAAPGPLLRPDGVALAEAASTRPPRVEPLAPERYKVQFTASAELREKLTRLQALMRASVHDGDLAAIIDQAVTEKLERLEARRFAKAKSPRKSIAETDTSAPSRYVPAAVRRTVHARDGGRCTFRDAQGRRCTARDRLEFHHHGRAFGRVGDHRPDDIRLMCRSHNEERFPEPSPRGGGVNKREGEARVR
ncbi:MAG: hypothetical protein ACYTFT_16240 [Planctomycetota bacterium]|jgi:hypothetical protein